MSFLARSPMRFRSVVSMNLSRQSPRTFSTSRTRFAMSESDTHRHEERAADIDKHKTESVGNAKDGKGAWKKELASNSEAAVKADRGDLDASQGGIDKLEKETQEILGNKKK